MHPMNMGGEYLPPMFDGEVEIARISLRSVTGDQISVRARRSRGDIEYRIVDEYPESGETYIPHPRTSTRRLTMGALVTMIDEATDEGGVAIGGADLQSRHVERSARPGGLRRGRVRLLS